VQFSYYPTIVLRIAMFQVAILVLDTWWKFIFRKM